MSTSHDLVGGQNVNRERWPYMYSNILHTIVLSKKVDHYEATSSSRYLLAVGTRSNQYLLRDRYRFVIEVPAMDTKESILKNQSINVYLKVIPNNFRAFPTPTSLPTSKTKNLQLSVDILHITKNPKFPSTTYRHLSL